MVARNVILMLIATMTCAASPFDGTWVHRVNGQNIFKLTLATENGRITGTLVKPKQVDFSDGEISNITPDQVSFRVQKATLKGNQVRLTIDGDTLTMTLEGSDLALLTLEGLPPWKFERVPDGSTVTLATSLSQASYSEDIRALRDQLRAMVKTDQETRFAFDEAAMKAEDDKNRVEVLRIFDKYGWVTNSLAGKDAAHNYWLLVQHQTPEIQRRLLPELEKAAKAKDASMSDYAYLYDRVQVGLGKPQHWGSQVSCKDGKPVLDPVDDPKGLDARRKELFMPSISEYLKVSYLTEVCAKAK
jgi:hypothetical protein